MCSLLRDGQPVPLDRLQAQLFALAADAETFTVDPAFTEGGDKRETELFEAFTVDLDKRQGEISDLTRSNADIRRHYTELVPEKVTHRQFWTRYFFRVHLIELQESKRQALRKRIIAKEEVWFYIGLFSNWHRSFAISWKCTMGLCVILVRMSLPFVHCRSLTGLASTGTI